MKTMQELIESGEIHGSDYDRRKSHKAKDVWLIWSNEHQAWWKPKCMGYTTVIERAGRYGRLETLAICNGANYGWNEDKNPHELPILESIAIELVNRLAA